jgi:hypothetical protein
VRVGATARPESHKLLKGAFFLFASRSPFFPSAPAPGARLVAAPIRPHKMSQVASLALFSSCPIYYYDVTLMSLGSNNSSFFSNLIRCHWLFVRFVSIVSMLFFLLSFSNGASYFSYFLILLRPTLKFQLWLPYVYSWKINLLLFDLALVWIHWVFIKAVFSNSF